MVEEVSSALVESDTVYHAIDTLEALSEGLSASLLTRQPGSRVNLYGVDHVQASDSHIASLIDDSSLLPYNIPAFSHSII